MGTFPAPGAGAICDRKMTTERARDEVEGLVVMPSDGGALLVRQCKAKTVKDVNASIPMATSVAPCSLAQIVEQAHNGNAVSIAAACVREHMFVHFKGMLGKASLFLVVAIAAALEVARGQKIVDNGFDAGALSRTKDLTDPVFGISHVRHCFGNLYLRRCSFLQPAASCE